MAPQHSLDQEVEAERLVQHFQQSFRALPGSVYPALVLWAWFYWITRDIQCLVWAGMVHSWQALRWYLSWRYPTWKGSLATMQRAERLSVVQLSCFGVLWGLAPWMLMSHNDPSQLAVVILMVVGTMSGSAAGLAYSLKVGLAYLGTTGAMLALWMLTRGDLLDLFLGISMLVYTASVMLLFRNHWQRLVQVIRSRIELRQQSELLEQQNLALERLQQERSRLFATASHDLRQPVQALSLQAQTLEQALQGGDLGRTAQRMVDVTQTLSQSLDAILDLYQLESISAQAPSGPVDIDSLLFDASQMWRDIAERRGLQLRFRGCEAVMMAPRSTLQRVLYNLIDNALKFTPSGGVLVTVRRRAAGATEVARIEVWDTGIGIAKLDQARIFQTFFRAPWPGGTSAPQGLGLGLAAVSRVCAERGWPLGVRSRLGRGSVFSLDVPLMEDGVTNVTG
jgi:signal transduction histidine kinase